MYVTVWTAILCYSILVVVCYSLEYHTLLQFTWLWYVTVWTDTLCYSTPGCGMVQFGLTYFVTVYLVGVCYSLDCHTLLRYTWFWYGTALTHFGDIFPSDVHRRLITFHYLSTYIRDYQLSELSAFAKQYTCLYLICCAEGDTRTQDRLPFYI